MKIIIFLFLCSFRILVSLIFSCFDDIVLDSQDIVVFLPRLLENLMFCRLWKPDCVKIVLIWKIFLWSLSENSINFSLPIFAIRSRFTNLPENPLRFSIKNSQVKIVENFPRFNQQVLGFMSNVVAYRFLESWCSI
jgi:hypothetical protein